MFGVFAAQFELHAQTADFIRTSPDWSKASVVTDGGSVYSKADFDSPVSDYLTFKTKIWVTKKGAPGAGGLGIFHKVRYKNKSGFMADTDIKIADQEGLEQMPDQKNAKTLGGKAAKKKKKKTFEDEEEDDEEGDNDKAPVFFHRYIGGALAFTQYTEKYSGNNLSSMTPMYGLRMSGPGVLGGMPLDFNFLLSLQAPNFYKNFAASAPKGFMIFGDIGLQLPLATYKESFVHYGLGILYIYNNWTIPVTEAGHTSPDNFSSQDFRIGVDFDLGYTYRLSTYAIKADLKYYIEKTMYFGAMISFQAEY